MTRNLLDALFRPRGVAVVGASDDPMKLSGRPLDYLLRFGYPGRVVAINPTRDKVQGVAAYPSLAAVEPEVDIDLAIIAVSAERTAAALRDCAARGVAVAVAFASGYAETGAAGAALQDELRQICAETGIRLMGPNCLGYLAVPGGVTATFSSALDEGGELRRGPVAFASQSGAFGAFIFVAAQNVGLGMDYFLNTGNEVDLTVPELLGELAGEEGVGVLLAYLEGVADGGAFADAARRAAGAGKPVVAVKVGRTPTGARAAASHTASLAGADDVFDAVARQLGVIRVDGMDPLIDTAQVLASGRRAAGRRLTIISMSGGAGALAADLATDAGLSVDAWEGDWRDRMAAAIPAFGSAANPVDLTASVLADPGIMEQALEVAIEHPETDLLMVMMGNADRGSERIVAAVADAYHRTTKPFVATWTGGSGRRRQAIADQGVPIWSDPGRAVNALARLTDWSLRPPIPDRPTYPDIDEPAARAVIGAARAAGRRQLDEAESAAVLSAYGVPVAPSVVASTPGEAGMAAQGVGFPVAVKLLSSEVGHKSDLGGVCLSITSAAQATTAGTEILAAAGAAGIADRRLLVQRMAPPGVELVLGVHTDPTFGPVVMAGLGGVLVEVLADTALALPPFDAAHGLRMLESLRGARLLDAFRGRPAVDRQAVADMLARLSLLAVDLADVVSELDINPVMAGPTGALAVDALVVLHD